jgi:hypothetical protein
MTDAIIINCDEKRINILKSREQGAGSGRESIHCFQITETGKQKTTLPPPGLPHIPEVI